MKRIIENKGITLIALVITIIVLLILAGVSIAMLTGENGLLTKAGKARDDTKLKGEAEKVQLAVYDALVNIAETEDKELTTELVKN